MAKRLEPTLVPRNGLRREGDWWISTGDDPYFVLDVGPRNWPTGWSVIRLDADAKGLSLTPTLYFDGETGLFPLVRRCRLVAL